MLLGNVNTIKTPMTTIYVQNEPDKKVRRLSAVTVALVPVVRGWEVSLRHLPVENGLLTCRRFCGTANVPLSLMGDPGRI